MQCKISGCEREASYKAQSVCQKHYFRYMRNGTYGLVRTRNYRVTNPAGYQKIFEPNHPMAMDEGYAYEHRVLVFNRYGYDLPDCELCGRSISWETCHIDHKDEDPTNNSMDNIRPVCQGCNTKRGRKSEHEYGHHFCIEFDGVKDTPTGWAKDPRVKVCSATIRRRKMMGMSDYNALFAPKKTHTGRRR